MDTPTCLPASSRLRRPAMPALLLSLLAGLVLSAATLSVQAAPALFGAGPLEVERSSAKVVGVYVPMWESPAHVDRLKAGSVTHLLYAFLRLCGPGQLAKDAPKCVGKQDYQLTTGPVEKTFDAAFQRLKTRSPHVKVLASVGGWGGSDGFFHLANDAARRAVFAQSVQQFLREHPGFDGVDIDWEHPGDNGAANGVALGSPADGQGYAELMHDLRRALLALEAENGRPYLLTTAVNTTAAVVDRIEFKRAAEALDLVFMMSYDFYGNWSARPGHHSSLMSSLGPDGRPADDSLDQSVRNLDRAGVPRAKMVAGVAMYGRGFSGVERDAAGLLSKRGGYPGADGSLVYREIAARYLGPKGQGLRGFRAEFDARTQAWSLVHPRLKLWIGYDDPRAVRAKGQYVLKNGLAGVFAWELSQDNGDLLNAMNEGVGNLLLQP